ncbi:SLC13 family permease [Methanotrichaceae archaeon Mx]|uniref:SLC13 family permease n=2 Tax=Candidatus Methanocrinis natronophilus TaxID=3033396 RepID=A0ABT5X5R3_9EURY|nr:SLC13 family permease [Candidatus Methanocrinis natronophilus]MDF0589993.1 SLC13 family permease [Candidatus Methanocrinis natronophilus]
MFADALLGMTTDQLLIFGVLGLTLLLFIWGRWRYDIVSLLALITATVVGLVPWDQAFLGFGHPAVITVAAVLVASRGLLNSGAVDIMAGWLSRAGDSPTRQVASLTGLVTLLSGFMNNVGAMALLLPVSIRMAIKSGNSPSILLMPLAFGSLLGGLITMIGTPPNIIIATFRAESVGEPFGMFDFTPVGLGVAVAGLLFISLLGWRLVPVRKSPSSKERLFEIENYLAEVHVPEGARMAGKTLQEVREGSKAEFQVLGLLSGETRIASPSIFHPLISGDILLVESDADELKTFLDDTGFQLGEEKTLGEEALSSKDTGIVEAVVKTESIIIGRTARSLNMRWRYGVNLVGVARHGVQLQERLGRVRFQAGDVLLLQGPREHLPEILNTMGCLPLAERGLRLAHPRRIVLSVAIFGSAILAVAAGILPVQIALVSAAVAMVMGGLLNLREVYTSIDWPVIILLGAMIPVGRALETTGGAGLIAESILAVSGGYTPIVSLAMLLVITMFLSDIVNNAAAAVLMAPIGLGIASFMGLSPDPFLMAVAIGASCAFLTPIGHQSNTLVMGPGGYHFGDYWRMGLPMEVVIAVVSIPLIVIFWPFSG